MLTKKQVEKCKQLLLQQREALVGEGKEAARNSLRDSVDELSIVDNHPADLATELYEREKDMALEVHGEATLAQIDEALDKMKQGIYGICETCSEAIPFERLEAIPYTRYCIQHTVEQSVASDRPIEETIILPPVDDSFSNRQKNDALQDDEDSFRLVAQYGNSDTPADFEGDYIDYHNIYVAADGNESISDLDVLHISQDEYLGGQISKGYAEAAREVDYLEDRGEER